MEAVGSLAGGIAHDFNNILTAISGFAQISAARVDSPVVRSHLEQIQRATNRGAGLTRQLLAFARPQPAEVKIVDLNDVVRDVHRLLRRVIGENVELVSLPARESATVMIDPGQLEHVLTNLALNARDAMPRGGTLTISVQVEAESVVLIVKDNGEGMTDEVKRRAFEPFFTTKPQGRGTGLGLSSCFSIIEQSHGSIDIDSAVGVGTRFRITLPHVIANAEDRTKDERRTAMTSNFGAGETVLLVEDDFQVRTMIGSVLAAYGYRVLEADNGNTALEVANEHGAKIGCVVTDVVMPILGGGELVRALRQQRPLLPIVVVSGYVDDPSLRDDIATLEVEFLSKPFTTDELLEKLRAAHDHHGLRIVRQRPA